MNTHVVRDETLEAVVSFPRRGGVEGVTGVGFAVLDFM